MTTRIEDVVRRHLCTGCGACAAACPSTFAMRDVAESGRRPVALRRPTRPEERRALAACPGVKSERPEMRDGADEAMGTEWGPILEIWEGHAADPDVRFSASSGGAVTALAAFALQAEGFKGVAHIKADPSAPVLNVATISRKPAEVIAAAGSRYAPASPCESLPAVAAAKGRHVFIGKPCDVEAATRLAREDDALARNLGLTISIFCAGVPSLKGTMALLQRLGVDNVAEVSALRYRGTGWPGTMAAVLKDGRETEGISYQEGWGNILQKHRQWRCHVCADHTGEHADLSIGDPWDRPSGQLDEPGRSLIIVRSARGREFLAAAMKAGVIVAGRRENNAVALAQPNLSRTRRILFGRLAGLRLMGLAAPAYPGYGLAGLWLKHAGARDKLTSILGTMKRAFARKLWRAEAAAR